MPFFFWDKREGEFQRLSLSELYIKVKYMYVYAHIVDA